MMSHSSLTFTQIFKCHFTCSLWCFYSTAEMNVLITRVGHSKMIDILCFLGFVLLHLSCGSFCVNPLKLICQPAVSFTNSELITLNLRYLMVLAIFSRQFLRQFSWSSLFLSRAACQTFQAAVRSWNILTFSAGGIAFSINYIWVSAAHTDLHTTQTPE